MEKITYCWLLTICILAALIYLLKFSKAVWIKLIEVKDRRELEAKRDFEQEKVHTRKIEMIKIQGGIRVDERTHELILQENRKALIALEITLKEKEIELKGK